ncbi:MAG: M1 family aminopeptidase [Chitinophagaceae bacterium]
MKKFFLLAVAFATVSAFGQQAGEAKKEEAWKKLYREVPTKENALIHTKLQASFDYEKSQLLGKVWLTLKPHFYATNKLRLDAKGMDISEVAIVKNGKNTALSYTYDDGLNLHINLDKTYTNSESYTVYIKYVAKPDEFKAEGSAAITDAKGLYFINPKGEEKDKPTQIWTQGETEATSVWVPTIDKTNQKSTQEFFLTVPNKYVTLSNGKLISQTKNTDGTRTDFWKMDLPHAPYLFYIGVGDYAVVKDTYKGKEVSYFVEKEYEKVAKRIFGNTPEMMKFFSEKVTGVEYPWVKYAQITGQDYVSGAMENTTATLHGSSAQQNARELVDGNVWEGTVAHELFHQWFGDYVTAESWSNLTVNESFADYSEYLWDEYKYGQDAAGETNDNAMRAYLNSKRDAKKDLVRFYYNDKEDMFDLVSYQKGGRILNMLRNYVGDDAFFKSLNHYLTTNKFGTGSGHKLRLSFEAVTGKDLNWFFNQWYFGSGHPNLEIENSYDAATKKVMLVVKQTQEGDKLFKLPVKVDVYIGKNKERKEFWIENKVDTFYIDAASKPDLVRFDGDNVLLANKKETKTIQEYITQYYKAGRYVDRKEALDFAAKNKSQAGAFELLKDALNDKFQTLRIKALSALQDTTLDETTLRKIEIMAEQDAFRTVRAKAIDVLAATKLTKYKALYNKAINDSSYTVAGAALDALASVDEKAATIAIAALKKDMKGRLKASVESVEVFTKTDADFEQMFKDYNKQDLQEKFYGYKTFATFIGRLKDITNFKKGVDNLISFRNQVAPFGPNLKDNLNRILESQIAKKLDATTDKEKLDYLSEKMK